jgi:ATP-binding cassette subfamily F protein 3
MAILTATNLGQSFGALDIFSDISISIPNDGKVGLVGPNGIGKTSLLLILAGLSKPNRGTVYWARGKRLGYLPQESDQAFSGREHSVYKEMVTVFADLRQRESHLRQLEELMARGDSSEAVLEQYGSALEQFEMSGGYDYEVRIKQVLQGLGFAEKDRELPLNHLSGGQKTRALLARLLLEKPELLILDEPTNHLDVGALEWLEGTLRVWEGAILLVSHDRYFLDRVINTVWEMNRQHIEEYRGDYSSYVRQRQERWALNQQTFDAQKERLEKELGYIRKNIAGQRTQMAKGKLSRISRELDAIGRGGLEATKDKSWAEISNDLGGTSRHSMSVAEATEALRRLKRPDGRAHTFDVRLKSGQRSGQIVLRTSNLGIGYPGNRLFTAEDIELHRQECAALIGPNGSGKTTFLKTLLGQLTPLEGEIFQGASLDIAYFAQAHEQLNPENNVIDELMSHHTMLISEARNYLGRYLFRGDDVYKPISAISGGERGRLALAILALQGANFLLLDEPTNHLDIPAQEMLQDVLEEFEGTILLVSHDRYLVDRLATQLWYLDDGQMLVFKGPYKEYIAEREAEALSARDEAAESRANGQEKERVSRQTENTNRRRIKRLADVESAITELEKTFEELGQELQEASASEAFDRVQILGKEYTAVAERLESLLSEWENLAHEQTLAR